MIFIFALSSRHRLPQPMGLSPDLISLVGHFTVYIVLTALLWAALPSHGWSDRRRLALAFIGTMVYALSDEIHQSFVLGREPTAFDLAIDAVGALCALVVIDVATRAYRRLAKDRGAEVARH